MQFDRGMIGRHFGGAAMHYDRGAQLQHHVRGALVQLLAPQLGASARVLDSGCGTGAFARQHGSKDWRITQLDLAEGMCRKAAEAAPCAAGDAAQLPFARGAFDAVFSSLMLQWCNDPAVCWQEMARVVTPGGYVAVSTLAEGTLDELRRAFARVDDKPHVSEFFSADEIIGQARRAGLRLLTAQQRPVVEYFPDAIAAMRSLQFIGAANKHRQRRRGLMTPAQFARVEKAYEHCRAEQGLPVTWQPLCLLLEKG